MSSGLPGASADIHLFRRGRRHTKTLDGEYSGGNWDRKESGIGEALRN